MGKRTRFWWSVFATALVVVLALWQWQGRRAPTSLPITPSPTPLPTLFPATFAQNALRIELYQGETLLLRLERSPEGTWIVTQGPEGQEGSWTTAVPLFLQTRVLAQLPADTERAAVGLAQPQGMLRVTSMDTFYTVEIGGPTPLGNGYYVRRVPRGEILALSAAVLEPWLQLLRSPGTPTPEKAPTPSPGGG